MNKKVFGTMSFPQTIWSQDKVIQKHTVHKEISPHITHANARHEWWEGAAVQLQNEDRRPRSCSHRRPLCPGGLNGRFGRRWHTSWVASLTQSGRVSRGHGWPRITCTPPRSKTARRDGHLSTDKQTQTPTLLHVAGGGLPVTSCQRRD